MNTKINTRLLLVSFCCFMLSCLTSVSYSANYYISTQADFDTYRQVSLNPGDNVFFERGKTFNGMFAPAIAVGAQGNMIKISTFGNGERPIIQNNGVLHPHPTRVGETISAGVFLFNSEYVEVEGLEVTNNNGGIQNEDLFGIYVLGEDTNKYHNDIFIKNNYVHHVNGMVEGKRRGGIHVHGYSPQTSGRTATYNNLRIENNIVNHVGGVGIGTDIDDVVDAHSYTGRGIRENAITNLYVAHNWVGNTGRNSIIARDSDHAVYEYNTSAYSSRASTGNSLFNFKTLGLTWQYNEVYGNTGDQPEPDRGAIDADYNSKDTLIQYNYTHENDWFASIMKRPNNGVIIRHNLSVNDNAGYFYGFENDDDLLDLNVYNNTHFFGSGIDAELIALNRTPLESTFNNNIFYAVDQGTPGVNADDGDDVTYDTNVYHNFTSPSSEANPLTLDPQLFSPGAIPRDIDMQFGRDVLNGYRLINGSPYQTSGVSISDPGQHDFWGVPLTPGQTPIGASQPVLAADLPNKATGHILGDNFGAIQKDLEVADPENLSLFGADSEGTLTQTFQVAQELDINTIFLGYDYDPAVNGEVSSINIEIFEVSDVASSSLSQGSSLLTITGLAVPNSPNSSEFAIVLDSTITLPATAGSSGYGLRISNGGSPGFEWFRTGSTSGSVYDFGQAYKDGEEILGGGRDFILSFASTSPFESSGDFNGDGVVDAADYSLWRDSTGQVGNGLMADANGDGIVDENDYHIWVIRYGTAIVSSSSVAVPEPISINYCLIAISWFLSNKRIPSA